MSNDPQREAVTRIYDTLLNQGEGLLNIDIDGVDPNVAWSLANEIASDFVSNTSMLTFTDWKFVDVEPLCQECEEALYEIDTYNGRKLCSKCYQEINAKTRRRGVIFP